MSEPDPPIESGGANRPLLFALAGLAVVLGVARAVGDEGFDTVLAGALLLGVPLVAAQLGAGARVFLLAAALGGWLVFRPPAEPTALSAPALVVNRLAYFAVPPLVLSLALAERDRVRLKLDWVHLYAPAVVMGLAALVHLVVRWGAPTAEAEIRRAAAIYGGCYLVLIVVAVILRARPAAEGPRAVAPEAARGVELEEQGRYALAARVYEREGQVESAARAAERAGDWPRAARLYRQAGDDFTAAEMYYRAQMWAEALQCYEEARALPAAARLCLQLGQVDRAVALYEQSGDPAAAVRAVEEAGQRPTGEHYRRAGMLDKAAASFSAAGDWRRAADIFEHELEDAERAAALHLQNRSFVHAGRLLESLGRRQEALEAYAATPAGAVDAARLYLAAGRSREAANLLAHLPPAELEKLEDAGTLTTVARVMLETGRLDEAIRILQGLKRRGAAGGSTRLLLGRAFKEKALPDLAEEELRIATSMPLDPAEETQAAYLLACVLEAAGKDEEALQVFYGILQKDLQYADVQERYRRLKARAKPRAYAGTEQ